MHRARRKSLNGFLIKRPGIRKIPSVSGEEQPRLANGSQKAVSDTGNLLVIVTNYGTELWGRGSCEWGGPSARWGVPEPMLRGKQLCNTVEHTAVATGFLSPAREPQSITINYVYWPNVFCTRRPCGRVATVNVCLVSPFFLFSIL